MKKKEECVAMVRIQRQSGSNFVPFKSKASVVSDLKDKIAEVNYKKNMGAISEEEANLQISALNAKIESIESGCDFKTMNTEEVFSDNSFEPYSKEDSDRLQQNHEQFMEQQATNNRFFHGI